MNTALGLLALAAFGLPSPHLLGLALCIAAGFGTSGAVLHRLAGGDAQQAARLVIGSSLLALPLMFLLVAVALGSAAQMPLLVRNLGGAILLARVLPESGKVLLAITAFGVPMYMAALLGLLCYRQGLHPPIEN